MRCFKFLLFFAGLLFGQTGMAVSDNFYFTDLNIKDGLSQQTVTVVFQDADGFMWFGTRNGLNRYDGYEFKIYQKDYDNTHSLSENYIQAIAQDKSNDIWIGTKKGLNRIDYETEKIHRYNLVPGDNSTLNINAIHCTNDGKLLVGTGKNSFIYDRQLDSFKLIEPEGYKLAHSITAINEDKQGNIYMGTSAGSLLVLNKEFKFIKKLDKNSVDSFPSGVISYLFVGEDGEIWIVSEEKYLSCYQPAENKLTRFTGLTSVRQIIDWDSESMLAGTFHGLVLINKKSLQATGVTIGIGRQGGLSHYSILCLYKDRQENLWVGTYSGGVNYYNEYNYRFNYIQPPQFTGIIGMGAEDEQGNMWFATEGSGLLFYDVKADTYKSYLFHREEENTYNKNIIKSILMEKNTILCATHGGEVYSFSIPQKKYTRLYNFGYNDINFLFRDSSGRLWIPTNTGDGLIVMDGDKEIKELNAKKRKQSIGVITCITEINKDCILLGTQQSGVYILHISNNKLDSISSLNFGFSGKENIWVTSMRNDANGGVWIATNGAGLFYFDSQLELKKRYYKANGLADERVYSIMGNGDTLWLMTSIELYSLEKDTDELKRFYTEGGLIREEFTMAGGTTGNDGKLYLAGAKGFLIVDPKVVRINHEIPPVWLTTLKIDNEIVVPEADNKWLTCKLQLQDKIILKPRQTNITIGYTALNYIYPEQNQYAYKLTGVDEKWNYVGNRREAFYSNLKPGEYTFHVIASNNAGVWNNEGTQLKIVVLWPLWLRWWAILLYIVLIVYIIYRIVLARHRKHELERSLRLKQLEQEKLKELSEERTRFFTNVTHEFRTPLTLIINPLDDLVQKYAHIVGIKEPLAMIRRNAQRLLSLVNSLMDIEKQRSEKSQLALTNFDIIDFIKEIGYSFSTVADHRGTVFRIDTELQKLPVTYDKEKLEQVFFNLLSNAFKFTPEYGTITIRINLLKGKEVKKYIDKANKQFETEQQWLYIQVEDNGVGIKPEAMGKIFEPFYHSQEDIYGQVAGSGIGLSLSKSIVEQHKGLIFAKPKDQGTVMCVILPYNYEQQQGQEYNYVLVNDSGDVLVNDKKNDSTPGNAPVFKTDYKLLLVEDNIEVLDYLKSQLSAEYEVFTAKNGKEALDIVGDKWPDMIISDVMMPEMDGIELCTIIKKDIQFCHIPVILLTAKSMAMHVEEGFSVGADDYITKPFSISLLKIRIRNIFTNRQQMKEIFGKKLSLDSLGIEVKPIDQVFMDRYVEIVRKNFTNTNFDVEMICKELAMSRANFYKKLKTITDLSPAEMIRNIRLESAAQLLKESKMTISEISTKVGFSSNSYFGSCFKALYGVSPKEYQNIKN